MAKVVTPKALEPAGKTVFLKGIQDSPFNNCRRFSEKRKYPPVFSGKNREDAIIYGHRLSVQ
jgi:hypothetical protein